MKATLSKRKNILAKIDNMPDEKLDELLKVISTFDSGQSNLKDNMSIIGNWTEIDDELILDYGDRLVKRLSRTTRRIK